MTKHTPTPWHIKSLVSGNFFVYDNGAEQLKDAICGCPYVTRNRTQEENEANAEFIVRACNLHDELVEALSGTVNALSERAEALREAYNAGDFEAFTIIASALDDDARTARTVLTKTKGE